MLQALVEVAEFDWMHLTGSKQEDIDVVLSLDEADLEAVFELYQEAHDLPLAYLTGRLR